MEIHEQPDFRVVVVDREAVAETLLLAEATGWEILTVTALPDRRVQLTMTQ